MKKAEHLVAFIDILGFKNIVENYYSGKDKDALLKIKKALKDAEVYAVQHFKRNLKSHKLKLNFKQFSDCVSISLPLKNTQHATIEIYAMFIVVIRFYSFILISQNILVRGGVSKGQHYENNNMIFSNALIKSYTIESKIAIYPRIIIEEEIFNQIYKLLQQATEEEYNQFYKIAGKYLIRDWDDEIFISPLGIFEPFKDILDIEPEFMNNNKSEILSQLENLKLPNDSGLNSDEIINLIGTIYSDEKTQEQILLNIQNETAIYYRNNKNSFSHDVKLKYKWLMQFISWNLNPINSSINFKIVLPENQQSILASININPD